MAYGPIRLANMVTGAQQTQWEFPEAASQTFKRGSVVKLSSGQVVLGDTADPWTSADVVLGVSAEAAHNLTVAATPSEGYSIGAAEGQPSSKTIPVGVPYITGNIFIWRADNLNQFYISLKAGQTYSSALITAGAYYTLKYDSGTGFWYLDSSDTTGNNAVAQIMGVDSNDNTWVIFKFKASQAYFSS